MRRIHLVTPRTGANNAGGADCIECGMTVFQIGGAIAYDPETDLHTTDPNTFFEGSEGEFQRCIPGDQA